MNSLQFGRIEIRPAQRLVVVDGRELALGARAFDVLTALAERRDRVVSKDELLDIVWPGIVVEENNLSVQISALRKALGAHVIATVTGRGYRFVAAEVDVVALPRPPAAGALGVAAPRVVRRLAAVLAGEAAPGGAEPAAAEAARDWGAARRELIEPALAQAGGRTVELTAQAMLIELGSAVEAVRFALQLQEALAARRALGARLPHLKLGLAVEDVIVEDDRLIGDGVRLARHLAALAEPGALLVTGAVRAFTAHKLPVEATALPPTLLDTLRVEVHRLAPAGPPAAPADAAVPRRPGEHLPGIAVLPFACEEADAYFGDGITEEIITALAMNRALVVIARHSTLRYRGTSAAPAVIAAELGVRYLLNGAVRRQGGTLRIGAELVEATTGRTLWAERFEGAGDELFAFQARIASSIAGAIDPWVQRAEIARAVERPTSSLGAYDCVLRALAVMFTFAPGDFEIAGTLLQRAIELDAQYAQANAHLAWWHLLRFGEGRSPDAGHDARAAEQLAQRAIELDPHDAFVLSVAGHIQAFLRRRFDVAMTMFDQALAVNPNCAVAWARSGTTLAYLGRGDEALERVSTALRLSPFDPQRFSFFTTCGTAAIVTGRYDEAVGWFSKSRVLRPTYHANLRLMVAALALAGEVAEARALAREVLHVEPDFRIAAFGAWYPMQEPARARLLEGLRLAGLPE